MMYSSPYEVRLACRENRLEGFASRALPGYLCVNVIFLQRQYAEEFAAFCRANAKPCPLLKVFAPGQIGDEEYAADLDIRTDLGSYDVIRDGAVVEQRRQLGELFDGDTVTFLVGSSVSFDGLLAAEGLGAAYGPVLYTTGLDCEQVGMFYGKMVVTMRSFRPELVDRVAAYTAHFPQCHGGPIGRGDSGGLGIADAGLDMRGNPVEVPAGTERLYWACGVTPSLVLQTAKIPAAVTYTPGHALITDIPTEQLYTDDPEAWYEGQRC